MPNKSSPSAQHIKCQNCSISELCLPFTLNDQELKTLDDIIDRMTKLTKVKNAIKQMSKLTNRIIP